MKGYRPRRKREDLFTLHFCIQAWGTPLPKRGSDVMPRSCAIDPRYGLDPALDGMPTARAFWRALCMQPEELTGTARKDG